MMDRRDRCPTPTELERAYWSEEEGCGVRLHVRDCARCGGQWQEIEALITLGRAVQAPPSSERQREELRTALLSRVKPEAAERPASRRARPWLVAAPLLAAAAAAAIWSMWPARETPAPAPRVERRGNVLSHDDARYLLAAVMPDEIIRLVEGTITVEVEPLQPGERFRVITGDAEVEVRGTAFDVTARGDRLAAVRVIHGAVEVRAGQSPPVRVGAGESWTAPAAAPTAEPASPAPEPPLPTPAPRRAPPPTPALVAPPPDAGRPLLARSPARQAFDEGWRAIGANDFSAAALAFERAAADPDLAEDASFWRAVALARGGRAVPAARAFEAFLAAHPDAARAGEASAMLGWLLFERGEHRRAADRFRAALEDTSPRVRESAAAGLKAIDDLSP
jgi:hypothetical protein